MSISHDLNTFIPRELRREVRFKGFAWRPDGSNADVLVSDLSYQGCRIECPWPFEIGERFELVVSRLGRVPAEVRWSAPGMAGVRFIASQD